MGMPSVVRKKPLLQRARNTFSREGELWLISILALAFLFLFSFLPMLGNYIGFVKYKPGAPIFSAKWVGLKYIQDFFSLPDVWNVIRNTLVMGSLNITVGFAAPILLALLFNELRNGPMKRVVQTVSYLPHFVSWVVVASIAFSLLSSEGLLNEVLLNLGFITKPIDYINNGKGYWLMITLMNIWKSVGWGSIIYISAITGIDQELYQAGAVDGLGRFGMVWHITLPGIATTIAMLFILGAGNIINGGFEQHLLLGTALTREYYETIDTYVYRYGLELGRLSFATSVGFLKGLVAIALLVITNTIVKKTTDNAIY